MSNNIYKKLANAQGKFVKKDDKKMVCTLTHYRMTQFKKYLQKH